jgi:hypothetical protein
MLFWVFGLGLLQMPTLRYLRIKEIITRILCLLGIFVSFYPT